jgi:tol-pal system protein YbgF
VTPVAFRVVLAALALACAAQGARAALFDDNEARKRIDETNQRLTQIQRQLDERVGALEQQLKSQGLVDLFSQVEQLKADLSRLRGQVEVMTYELEQSQKRQRDLYVDLDTRLRKIESAAAPAAGTPDANPPNAGGTGTGAAGGGVAQADTGTGTNAGGNTGTMPPRNPADAANEQRAYDAALDRFKRGDYAGAITGFTTFVKSYPRSPLAASAQYWLGNAQYARKDYRASIQSQRQLILNYPDNPKVSDAMLNIASAQADMGDTAAARRTLEDLMAKYPKSDAALKARQRLGVR